MLRNAIFAIVFMFALLPQAVRAAQEVTLFGIAKEESPRATRLALEFSALPRYELKTSGQRVDLFLSRTAFSSLGELPEDGRVIRTTVAEQQDRTMISFLLRQVPGKIDLSAIDDPARLVLDIVWSETSRPALATNLKGAALSLNGGATARRSLLSGYAGKWNRFFAEYETPLELRVPLRYTLPPLPTIRFVPRREDGAGRALAAAFEMAARGDWQGALRGTNGVSVDLMEGMDREALLILRGEALARTGRWERARRDLGRLLEEHPRSSMVQRAAFLSVYCSACGGDPFAAGVELSGMLGRIEEQGAYLPYWVLLGGEIALAKGGFEEALELLGGGYEGSEESLETERRLRLADAWRGAGHWENALRIYRDLGGDSPLWREHPSSLAGFAEALERDGLHLEAAELYEGLAERTPERESRDLLLFAAARARLHGKEIGEALTALAALRNDLPGSEGALRAWMKELDLPMAEGKGPEALKAAEQYGSIARQAPSLALRQEAAFKEALAHCLGGERLAGVEGLRSFLLQFRGAGLRVQAEALLAEVLPGAVGELLERGEELQALVLLEQNRSALIAGRFSSGLLLDLGEAFAGTGLLERAVGVYRHILDGSGGSEEEERFYLPLVEALVELRDFDLAARYAARYLERFPKGKERESLRLLQGRALYGAGRSQEAAQALLAGPEPATAARDELAGSILFELGDFAGAARCLGRAPEDVLSARGRMLRAEALLRSGRGEDALSLLDRLSEEGPLTDQALYRSAQIRMETGEAEAGLNILRRLVEEGRSSYWKRMAGETLAVAELQKD